MKTPRVYGGVFMYRGKMVRGIFAGTQAQAAKATGMGLTRLQIYWCQTANKTELSVALAHPGILFYSKYGDQFLLESDYKAVEK